MTYTLVIVQSLLMLLVGSSRPAPVSGSWGSIRMNVPAAWSIGESRWIVSSVSETRAGAAGASHGLAISWSLKTDLASLSAMKAGSFNDALASSAMPGGVLMPDRVSTPSLQDAAPARISAQQASPVLATNQYASAERLYYVPAGISGFTSEFGSQSASLDSTIGDPVSTPPGGGVGGGTDGGGVTPPDLGGSAGHGGIRVPLTPEPSGAILTLLGLSITCGRRRTRH